MYLRVPARVVLIACLAMFTVAAVYPSVTTGIAAAMTLLAGCAVLFALDAASRAGRSAARRWRQ